MLKPPDDGQDDKDRAKAEAASGDRPRIELVLRHGGIESIHEATSSGAGKAPIDAIAVGHYMGVKPQAAELGLDRAISAALRGKLAPGGGSMMEADLVLTQFSERGILRGELGQPFFLADPRPSKGADRLIAIAGMGLPGRFGVPELILLVRELCWSLGRLGRRHLATVLIGAGKGNIPPQSAAEAWLRGLHRALGGSAHDEGRRLERVTFVEHDARNLRKIQDTIVSLSRRFRDDFEIDYRPIPEKQIAALVADHVRRREAPRAERVDVDERGRDPIPVRVTFMLEDGKFRFGAITNDASIPEREIDIDPNLILSADRPKEWPDANDLLFQAADARAQLEAGQFFEDLVIPRDLREHLATEAPVVMLLDATTARVHWEMVALSDPLLAAGGGEADAEPGRAADFDELSFLGTRRGFTRQLRTTFAAPPEPPPPPSRVLRVLVIADPSRDAPLKGAREEGEQVAALLERFDREFPLPDRNSIKVVKRIGPTSRLEVLRLVMGRPPFDVIHYAGHCFYNEAQPSASGWILTDGVLSARELNRIDRIPKFVFSNACESGVTPDRVRNRSVGLAPSFAEAFFARGVSNFVCTAWKVDDAAALLFARTLYKGLLGLGDEGEPYDPGNLLRMHAAMRAARLAVAQSRDGGGARTWGAYQHYGNPSFQLFDAEAIRRALRLGKKAAPAAGKPKG